MQLEVVNSTRDKEILQVQMEHKVKIVKVLERHKIHFKTKVWMNIPLYHMISMPVVKSTLKIDVLKMEQLFQMGYQEGDKVLYAFPTNWQGKKEFVANHIHEWNDHWKALNASFEEALNADEDLQKFRGRMFYVRNGNHQLQA
jgi:hypothetical protein